PQAVAVALDLIGEAYRRNDRRIWGALLKLDRVLGLDLEGVRALARQLLPEEVERLSDERERARKDRNFAQADLIRGNLMARGYTVEDTPKGPRLKRRWSGSKD